MQLALPGAQLCPRRSSPRSRALSVGGKISIHISLLLTVLIYASARPTAARPVVHLICWPRFPFYQLLVGQKINLRLGESIGNA